MYGFGDDRNPGNDTVNVMEEILVEFITDVVCVMGFTSVRVSDNTCCSARPQVAHLKKHDYRSKTYVGLCQDQQMQRNLPGWKNCCSCRRTLNVQEPSLKNQTWVKQKHTDNGLLLSIIVTIYTTHAAICNFTMPRIFQQLKTDENKDG